MAKKLNSTVHVHVRDDDGNIVETVVVGPDDKLSPQVRKALEKNPRVWDDDEDDQGEPVRPGPSETADAGDQVEAAVEAAQEQRDAEHAAAVEANQPADTNAEGQPAARSTRARSVRGRN